jgi:hypothetical protein
VGRVHFSQAAKIGGRKWIGVRDEMRSCCRFSEIEII